MPRFDVVVIGGGLGGLLCANLLAKEGKNVVLVEKHQRLGGCIQSFSRDRVVFNTGLNYTESLGQGEVLRRYFEFFDIMDGLKLRQMDVEGFERISFAGDANEYPFAQGHDNFAESLGRFFPRERSALKEYIAHLQQICKAFPMYTLDPSTPADIDPSVLKTSAYGYLQSIGGDPKLQQILAGLNSLYGGVAERTPLYVHALINSSFIRSSWRFVDGSSQLAAKITKSFLCQGGTLLIDTAVVAIGGENRCVKHVDLDDGNRLEAEHVISNLHPQSTLALTHESLMKKAYRSRVESLENSCGMFTLYIVFKKNSFPYLNYNHHVFKHINAWTVNYTPQEWPDHYMLYTPPSSRSEVWAEGLEVLTYMKWSEVAQWAGVTSIGQRSESYKAFKKEKEERLIDFISEKFPNLRACIETVYSSTPLTYLNYTGTPQGSAYGIMKDYNDPLKTIITPKTRIQGLYLTGQNLNMHGVLGVSIGAVMTSAEILGQDYLMPKLMKT